MSTPPVKTVVVRPDPQLSLHNIFVMLGVTSRKENEFEEVCLLTEWVVWKYLRGVDP